MPAPTTHARPLQVAPFTDDLPTPIHFRSARMPAEASFPCHRHDWGEFVYSFTGVMEVQLQGNPGDCRSIAELARTVHTTERTLMRRSQRELGMPLSEWRLRLRLRLRLRVLSVVAPLEAGQTVENIAHDLGYNSVSAFIAMFRRMMGATPDGYRKALAGSVGGAGVRR